MLAVLVALGCGVSPAPSAPAPAPVSAPAAAPAAAPTWAEEVALADAGIRDAERLAMRHADDWGRWERVAQAWSGRARLTGDYADHARAEDALAVAFGLAPAGSGPLLTRARHHVALHRLDAAERDLAVVAGHRLDEPQRAALLAVRGDIALQRGRLDEAEGLFRESVALHDTLGAGYGLVQIGWQRGDHDGALAGLDALEQAHVRGRNAATRMWFDLQRGLVELSRDRHDAALAHYQAAEADLAGHWLVREHVAEVTALLGRTDEALAMYERIVLDTHNPEFVSAVAQILAERGDPDAARWTAWADAGFARQLAMFPEAAAGHALDHAIALGDPSFAVALAERNAALRPNGEALEQLAAAYRKAGRAGDADRTLARR